jgi:hypothetical protein
MPARDAAAAHERTLRWLCRLDRPLNRRRPARRSAAGVAAGGWRRRPVRGRRSWGLQLTPILPDTDRNDLSIVRALPLAHATDPAAGIRIAYAMNGEPSARTTEPSSDSSCRIGTPSPPVKWLKRIDVATEAELVLRLGGQRRGTTHHPRPSHRRGRKRPTGRATMEPPRVRQQRHRGPVRRRALTAEPTHTLSELQSGWLRRRPCRESPRALAAASTRPAASRCQDPKPRLDQIYPIDRVMDATYRSLPSCRPWRCPDPRAGSATVPNCGARERAEGSVQRGSIRRAGARKPQSGAACPRPVSTEDRE